MNKKDTKKEFLSKLELMNQHHIFLWLILFFPIGIYLLYKYKILPKWMNILMIIILFIIGSIVMDTYLHPYRVTETNMNNTLKSYEKEIGDVIYYEQYNTLEDYYIYDIITNEGRYDVYVKIDGTIYSIKQVEPKLKDIYHNDKFNECYKDVYSRIVQFVNDNNISIPNQIDKVETEYEGCQSLTINNKKYHFIVAYEDVNYIVDENNQEIYTKENKSLKMVDKIYKKLCKRNAEIANVDYVSNISFEKDGFSLLFYTTEGNLYQIRVHLDGSIQLNKANSK